MLCCWFAMGLMKEELVEEGREEKAENWIWKSFITFFFFFNIVLTWKIVRVSKTSVLYIYI